MEQLEERALLSLAPSLVDLQAASDSGLYQDDNITNIRAAAVDITAAQAGDTIRVYRAGTLLGNATQVSGTLYQYTFAAGDLTEGVNSITARGFDGVEESLDSSSLAIMLDTTGPKVARHLVESAGQQPVSHMDLVLSEQVSISSITFSNMQMTGPNGEILLIDVANQGNQTLRVRFPTQLDDGDYELVFGQGVVDIANNRLDQDGDGSPGEVPDDLYYAGFAITGVYDALVFTENFDDPAVVAANWSPYGSSFSVNDGIGTLLPDGSVIPVAPNCRATFHDTGSAPIEFNELIYSVDVKMTGSLRAALSFGSDAQGYRFWVGYDVTVPSAYVHCYDLQENYRSAGTIQLLDEYRPYDNQWHRWRVEVSDSHLDFFVDQHHVFTGLLDGYLPAPIGMRAWDSGGVQFDNVAVAMAEHGVVQNTETRLVDYFPKEINGENGILLQNRLSDGSYVNLTYLSDYCFYTPGYNQWGLPGIYVMSFSDEWHLKFHNGFPALAL